MGYMGEERKPKKSFVKCKKKCFIKASISSLCTFPTFGKKKNQIKKTEEKISTRKLATSLPTAKKKEQVMEPTPNQ